MKTCTICLTAKPVTEFHKQASRADGLCSWCKPCKSAKKAEGYKKHRDKVLARCAGYRKQNPEKVSEAKKRCYVAKRGEYLKRQKAYYIENRSSILESCKQYRIDNPEEKTRRDKAYREANREKLNLRQSEYQRKNWDRIKAYQAEYSAKRYKSDPLYALSRLVRRRISLAIREHGYSKSSRTTEMLGCDYLTLTTHLESQFKEGMSWSNRGEWHIDHIIPLASAKSEADLLALCHYKNLQPLWASENLAKGARIIVTHKSEAA